MYGSYESGYGGMGAGGPGMGTTVVGPGVIQAGAYPAGSVGMPGGVAVGGAGPFYSSVPSMGAMGATTTGIAPYAGAGSGMPIASYPMSGAMVPSGQSAGMVYGGGGGGYSTGYPAAQNGGTTVVVHHRSRPRRSNRYRSASVDGRNATRPSTYRAY